MKNFLRRINLSPEFINNAGKGISSSFSKSSISKFNNYMAYYPIKSEAPVLPLIKYLIDNNKNVSIPSTKNDNSLIPVYFSDFNNITLGKYNIPEPEKKVPMDPKSIEVVFVPGVVFHRTGLRIGYGKGCYDRFLSESTYIKIGVCYEFQFSEVIAKKEKHDVIMDYLLTEKALYEVKK